MPAKIAHYSQGRVRGQTRQLQARQLKRDGEIWLQRIRSHGKIHFVVAQKVFVDNGTDFDSLGVPGANKLNDRSGQDHMMFDVNAGNLY
jgi:hypothetical protein